MATTHERENDNVMQLKDVQETQVILPLPPSTNALYANAPGKGRIKSAAYRRWLSEAGWELKTQRPHAFLRPVTISIEVRLKRTTRDLDNLLKPVLDLLGPRHHRIIRDDTAAVLRDLRIRVSEDVELEPGTLRVTIKVVKPPAVGGSATGSSRG